PPVLVTGIKWVFREREGICILQKEGRPKDLQLARVRRLEHEFLHLLKLQLNAFAINNPVGRGRNIQIVDGDDCAGTGQIGDLRLELLVPEMPWRRGLGRHDVPDDVPKHPSQLVGETLRIRVRSGAARTAYRLDLQHRVVVCLSRPEYGTQASGKLF